MGHPPHHDGVVERVVFGILGLLFSVERIARLTSIPSNEYGEGSEKTYLDRLRDGGDFRVERLIMYDVISASNPAVEEGRESSLSHHRRSYRISKKETATFHRYRAIKRRQTRDRATNKTHLKPPRALGGKGLVSLFRLVQLVRQLAIFASAREGRCEVAVFPRSCR